MTISNPGFTLGCSNFQYSCWLITRGHCHLKPFVLGNWCCHGNHVLTWSFTEVFLFNCSFFICFFYVSFAIFTVLTPFLVSWFWYTVKKFLIALRNFRAAFSVLEHYFAFWAHLSTFFSFGAAFEQYFTFWSKFRAKIVFWETFLAKTLFTRLFLDYASSWSCTTTVVMGRHVGFSLKAWERKFLIGWCVFWHRS